MWHVRNMEAVEGGLLVVREDMDLVELECTEHGLVAIWSSSGATREVIEQEAAAHRTRFHRADAAD